MRNKGEYQRLGKLLIKIFFSKNASGLNTLRFQFALKTIILEANGAKSTKEK